MRLFSLAIFILVMSACTTIPEEIQGTYPEVSPARVEPGVFGTGVRWGGVILSSRNSSQGTCFEILSRQLDKYLRPELEDSTMGRFIACKPGFHDPLVFGKGREITVTGQIEAIETRKVDDFDYRYPVLAVDDLVLWQKRKIVTRYRGYSDSYYGPWGARGGYWGGWGGYPYYRHPFPSYHSGYAEPVATLPDPAIIETRE